MRRHGNWLAIGALLALGMFLLGAKPAVADDEDDKQIKAAQKDILDLAKDIENNKVTDKQAAERAAAIRKKYSDLNHVMTGFKPRARKGIGYGAKGEGIEIKLNALGKRAPAAGQIGKESGDLLKMAYINLAYAQIATHYAPAVPKGGKGAKEWKQYTEDWKVATKEFIGAVKKSDPAALKTAANNITNACNSCHSDFRDAN